MSISGISTSSAYQQITSTSNQNSSRGSAMKSLLDSINTGDLTSAKTAFDALQKNQSGRSMSATATGTTSGTGGTSQRAQDMAALGQAIQSGDTDAAKQALTKLQQDHKTAEANGEAQGSQATKGAHHHHGHKTEASHAFSSPPSTSSSVDSRATYSPTASTSQTAAPGSTINVAM